MGIKADNRSDHDVRHDHLGIRARYRNVPHAAFQRITMRPGTKYERLAASDDHGQGGARSAAAEALKKSAKIRLSANRPIGADDESLKIADGCFEVRSDQLAVTAPDLVGNCEPLGNQSLALGLSPAHDIGA